MNVCANEGMHSELRVKTVIELLLHEQHYLLSEVVSFLGVVRHDTIRYAQSPRLHATSANIERASSHVVAAESTLLREIFVLDCLDTCKDGNYCNMWHIHALSSVFKCPIQSIYHQYIRPLLNKVVFPRQELVQSMSVAILWTSSSTLLRAGDWSPNHLSLV